MDGKGREEIQGEDVDTAPTKSTVSRMLPRRPCLPLFLSLTARSAVVPVAPCGDGGPPAPTGLRSSGRPWGRRRIGELSGGYEGRAV